ncbi:unnamed protein product [Cylicostephanus goldi]|uniref:E3 ubiquitin-protein ligase n=1 Tax=Cylicostephanus goldi TaxID=71465 RepID=A0A3P6SJL0_CYLGO|nr:unnamed protein product [Cylicostephanus goldi]
MLFRKFCFVPHSLECGGDACCFIALNSSLIVIVREGLAAVWGSVYLDAHGEEDRNLRRGKPLFLSARRVDCLRSDWAEQEFERTGATWSTMAGLQQILKDAHLFRCYTFTNRVFYNRIGFFV